jgi:phosphoglycerol transferase
MAATTTSRAPSSVTPPVGRGWRGELLPAAAAGLAALVLAAVALRLWDADLGVPLTGGGDALFFQMLVKGALEHGWTLANPSLGAPFGQELHDFPVAGADAVAIALVRLLGLVTSDAGAVVNAFYLLTFPLVAVAAYGVLRWLGASPGASIACAVIYAVAPYHFLRGESHLFLSAYFAVPIAAYLVLALLLDRPLVARRAVDGSRALRFASPRTLLTLALCVVVGTSDLYYIAFALLLLVGATVLATVAAPRKAPVAATGAFVVAAVCVSALIALSPNIAYRLEHGANPVTLDRSGRQSELFSLNLVELVLPVPGHRVERLATAQSRHENASAIGQESSPLGAVAAVGFLWLLGVALLGALAGRGRPLVDPRHHALAAAALGGFLIGTTGGVSAVVAWGLTAQIRTWGRMSVFLAFFALAAVALLLDAGWRRLGSRRSPPRAVAAAAGLAALVGVAFLDQTSPQFTPDHAAVQRDNRAQAGFVRRIEQRAGAGASIFQVPWVRFPDSPPFAGITDYDPARGYLHSTSLRWSYGAMKGRPADWSAELANAEPAQLLDQVIAAGFDGLWIDRAGYADRGGALEDVVRRRTRAAALVSSDRRYAYYDLDGRAAVLRAALPAAGMRALADVTLHPPRTRWPDEAFDSEERDELARVARWTVSPLATVEIDNPAERPRDVTLSMTLARPGPEAADVDVRFPDGTRATVRADGDGTRVSRRLRLAPGPSRLSLLTFSTPLAEAEGRDDKRVRVVGLRLAPIEAAAAAALRSPS